ncbi:uncharacterized protein L201_002503 [Kwoniella dendrophila CBS 6074]|uniref:RING-type domain-containing protein n=1 Tax=Kwoniella dendrophila CBS 6074 TaxID=1295534 RepID=A0AAX4JT25_9TREE
MRSPLRPTRNRLSNSPKSPNSELRPKPTVADIELAPRRRLRDGSTSSRGKSPASRTSRRGTSVSSTTTTASSRASRANSSNPNRNVISTLNDRRSNIMLGQNRSRRDSIASTSVISESDSGSYVPSRSNINSRESSLTPPSQSEIPQSSTSRKRSRSHTHSPIQEQDSAIQSEQDTTADAQAMRDRIDRFMAPIRRQHIPYLNYGPNSNLGPKPQTPERNQRNGSSSITSRTSDSDPDFIETQTSRRYTTAEKGKGRAQITSTPIEIESSSEEPDTSLEHEGDESIQFINITQKRKREDGVHEEEIDELDSDDDDVNMVDAKEVEEEESLAGGYTCPVCFCPPSQAVMTPCGHILCAQCLHSSLISAIGRLSNPYPDLHGHGHGPRGGRNGSRGGRGRGRHTRNSSDFTPAQNQHIIHRSNMTVSMWGPGPTAWTKDLLQQYWQHHCIITCEKQLSKNGVDKSEWEAIKDLQIPKLDDIKVEQKLKSLWRLEDHWVVEGECPVCRNPLPGGYGPPDTGIGGIIPLQARLSTYKNDTKRRR